MATTNKSLLAVVTFVEELMEDIDPHADHLQEIVIGPTDCRAWLALREEALSAMQITPEQQIANVQRALDDLRHRRRHQGRTEAIRQAERQLAEMEEAHKHGRLQSVDDSLPF